MASNFSNPRWYSEPCERMLNCSFAEKFLSDGTIAKNFGTITGTINVDRGATAVSGNIEYDIVTQPSGFSVVVKWSASALVSVDSRLIYNSASLHAGTPGTGFSIWLDADGIKANCSTGTTAETPVLVDLDYSDGAIHTATYVVDMDGGTQSLYVDLLPVDTQSIALDEEIGSTLNVFNTETVGVTLTKAVILDGLLEESDHDVYYTDTLTSFAKKPFALYPCNEFCDDTYGNKIWDRTTAKNDLYKADRVASGKFPTFDADKYFFDLVDDYVSNLSLPTGTYTNTGAISTPSNTWPEIQQYDDSTLTDLLTTEGGFWGYLHSMGIHDGVLSPMQKLQDKYNHLYWLWRGRAYGAYHRLITEDTCKIAMFLDAGTNIYQDYSLTPKVGIATGITRLGSDGVSFPNADSNIRIPDDPSTRVKHGTIAFYGDFDTPQNGNFIQKQGCYDFLVAFGTTLRFVGFTGTSSFAHTISNNEFLAVTFRDGEYPRLYVDGQFSGLGDAIITTDPTSTSDVYIGNYNALSYNCKYDLRQVYVGDEPLTGAEINALYEQMKIIGAMPMETGNRIRVRATGTGAIDQDVDPGGPFQLIDVSVTFDVAPTTSEDITIKSINSDTDTVYEHKADPSLSTELTHVYRFDKRFPDNTTIGVDYANTDANTVTVNTTYQMDQSVV